MHNRLTPFFDSFLDSLTDSAVRDLAWVIGAPGLLDAGYPAYNGQVVDDAWCRAQLEICAPWLAALDQAPQPLHDFIAARPTRRLGHYFETLIAFWLARVPDMQILATNLQVQDAQRTLGEYDFLLCEGHGKILHWEAAVKFYLQAEPMSEQQNFIGPGGQDRLDLKLDRVFLHQLKLGYTRAGEAALPHGWVLDKAWAFIKGYLFYAASPVYEMHGIDAAPPAKIISIPGISATHAAGWWVRYPVENLPQRAAVSHWMLLPRLRWLAPVRLAADARVMTCRALATMLAAHFSTSDEAMLVVEVERDSGGKWHELARGFVVCNRWPRMTLRE